MGLFSKTLGIDLGTVNTRIYKAGAGIILSQPSVVAVDKLTDKVLAVGESANEMISRLPDNMTVIRPVNNGVVSDFDFASEMLTQFITHSKAKNVIKPMAVAAIPAGITRVEKRAVEETVLSSGIKAVKLVEKSYAAALGAGISLDSAEGNMIVDIGGGTTEAAVVCLDGVVVSKSIKIAGNAINSAIISYVKSQFGISLGDRMAEDIKIKLGNVFKTDDETKFTLRGRDISTGLPKQDEITSNQVCDAINSEVMNIIETIKSTLDETPPELAADIMEKGITLTGGGAALAGLAELIKDELGVLARIAENPHECVIRGIGIIAEGKL